VYRRTGLGDRADAARRVVLAREPANLQALANLSLVLKDAGRFSEADAFAARLAEAQPIPPYRYFDQGMAAMRVGDFLSARDLFRKEIARDAFVSEFHFWLAIASYGMGDLAAARAEIAKAVDNSTTVDDRALYGAKQAWLNQQRGR
jgi:tetratricopeptide (TPR) repeat protein